MKPVISSASVRTSIEARILSWGTVRAWPEELAAWRKQPRPMPPAPFSPSLIRHSDDQVVAALWATCEAAAGMDAKPGDFTSWGVVGAPRMLAREGSVVAFDRFREEGVWGVSPHLVPHHSLHALTGTISQIFKTRGPNFGVGNGSRESNDGWLAAATLLSEGTLPGMWFVQTGHAIEYLPKFGDRPATRTECEAVSLALAPSGGGDSGLHLRFCPEELVADSPDEAFLGSMPTFSLSQLVDELNRSDGTPAGMWRLPGAGWIEIESR